MSIVTMVTITAVDDAQTKDCLALLQTKATARYALLFYYNVVDKAQTIERSWKRELQMSSGRGQIKYMNRAV